MKAGLLNEVVEILRLTATPSEFGGSDAVWAVDRKARANVIHKSGRLELSTSEAFPAGVVVFELHIFQKMAYTDRIRHGGRLYSIEDIEYNRQTRRLIVTTQRVNE